MCVVVSFYCNLSWARKPVPDHAARTQSGLLVSQPHAEARETPAAPHASVSTRLNSIFRTEGLSILLTNREDALRVRDLSAGYYASSEAPGHILPQIGALRSRLQNRGITWRVRKTLGSELFCVIPFLRR